MCGIAGYVGSAPPGLLARMLASLKHRGPDDAGHWVSPDKRVALGHRRLSIIDLSPANDSRFIIDVGQSGHVLSNHYDDFLEDWHAVQHRKMRMERTDIERGALGHLRLVPKSATTEGTEGNGGHGF